METSIGAHRKLIDLKPSVFDALSLEAAREGVSLKRFIESVLEKTCISTRNEVSPGIRRLIGSALPKNADYSKIEDDRLQYLLSK